MGYLEMQPGEKLKSCNVCSAYHYDEDIATGQHGRWHQNMDRAIQALQNKVAQLERQLDFRTSGR